MTTRYEGVSVNDLVDRPPEQSPRERQLAEGLRALRIVVGFSFLWAFLDKLFGLRLCDAVGAVLDQRRVADEGVPGQLRDRPVRGSLQGHRRGRLGGLAVHARAGRDRRRADARYRDAGRRGPGALLYLLMWTVVLPPETNPLVDDHIIGALLVSARAGARRRHLGPGPLVEAPADGREPLAHLTPSHAGRTRGRRHRRSGPPRAGAAAARRTAR